MADAVSLYLKHEVSMVWHHETTLDGFDCVLLAGGFSYGDYLRSGAIARFSPIMAAVKNFAAAGKPVLGVCNGFQILTETGLLPGALTRNQSQHFQCETVEVVVENNRTAFSTAYTKKQLLQLPIAHADGNYYADEATLASLEANNQVVFRYKTQVNGSCNDIAGICNAQGNVVGLMPHPERNLWESRFPFASQNHWNADGCGVFDSVAQIMSSQPVPQRVFS
ncbi:MAG: phosphoribosylformylglycinamidine synthase subunit PurQ [Cyanobacteria bacterium P01_H01_bin.74]